MLDVPAILNTQYNRVLLNIRNSCRATSTECYRKVGMSQVLKWRNTYIKTQTHCGSLRRSRDPTVGWGGDTPFSFLTPLRLRAPWFRRGASTSWHRAPRIKSWCMTPLSDNHNYDEVSLQSIGIITTCFNVSISSFNVSCPSLRASITYNTRRRFTGRRKIYKVAICSEFRADSLKCGYKESFEIIRLY